MKKVIFVFCVIALSSLTLWHSQKNEEDKMSDLLLGNVEALADCENNSYATCITLNCQWSTGRNCSFVWNKQSWNNSNMAPIYGS